MGISTFFLWFSNFLVGTFFTILMSFEHELDIYGVCVFECYFVYFCIFLCSRNS
ncbi:hypothetical protein [Bombilactobacillus bombi]|uniref:hypothetical protein n=1 Tax=Bombilactobacillus bombi TaxID=1303590 RepID=UPI00217552BB|nr:hypothetical protein [Bombilactobacillus bombi]